MGRKIAGFLGGFGFRRNANFKKFIAKHINIKKKAEKALS
jgi:hypothetical protein